ncbi:MAG: alpha/beta hydrolase [Peptococcaceae bacterium]|jgi:acetyl esterase/lipase|nr:alpha/beta hydrolase [Peptococcaceae bacterium]
MRERIKINVSQPDVALYGDIVYGNYFNDWMQENIPLKLCLLRPFLDPFQWEKLPLLIWVGGGAYRNSAPLLYAPKLTRFALSGYVVASVQYRVSSEGLFPAQIQDVKQSIRFLRQHAGQYGIDPERVAIGGDSAGGHLATLAGLGAGVKAFESDEWPDADDSVKAVINWYGGGDLEPRLREGMTPEEKTLPFTLLLGGDIEEKTELARLASPSNYITAGAPPFLIMHGSEDTLVPLDRGEALYDRLIGAGARAELYILDGAGHGTAEFAQPEIQEIMLGFLRRYV